MKMCTRFAIVLLASAMAGCATPSATDDPARGATSVNQPVVTRSDFAVDLAAPDGTLSPSEASRLDAWYKSRRVEWLP